MSRSQSKRGKARGEVRGRLGSPGDNNRKQNLGGRKTSPPLSVSQNFLTGGRTIGRILRLAEISPADHVVEIGPGKGHITRALAERCGRLTAVELDPVLCRKLREAMGGLDHLRLVEGDFLRWSLPAGPYKVFANIPFHITTGIVRKLTGASNPPGDAWLVVERGAAVRFCGQGGESLLSLGLKPWFRLSVEYRFRPEDFHPKPSASPVLLHIHRREDPDLPPSQQGAYRRFLERCHGVGFREAFTGRQFAAAKRLAGLPPEFTHGEVLYIQWLCLFRCWLRYHPEMG